MKKPVIIVGIIVVLLTVGGFVFAGRDEKSSTVSETTAPERQAESRPTSTTTTQGQPAADQSVSEDSQSKTIVMTNSSFSPASVTVKKGTKVTWINEDSIQHDVVPDDTTDEFRKSALFGKGGTYSVTFDTPGTYTYFCTPHASFMKGTIVVTE